MITTISQLLGITLLSVSLLSKEHEENFIETHIRRLWARVDTLVERGISVQTALTRETSGIIERALRWTVGDRLLSLRAAWTSIWLSAASCFFFFWLVLFMPYPEWSKHGPFIMALLRWAIVPVALTACLFVGLLPRFIRKAEIYLWSVVGMWVVLEIARERLWVHPSMMIAAGSLTVAILGAIASDLIALGLLRSALQWNQQRTTFLPLVVSTGLVALLTIALLIGPVWLEIRSFLAVRPSVESVRDFGESVKLRPVLIVPWLIPVLVSISNILTATFVGAHGILLAAALVYRVVGSLSERTLNALARHGVFCHRKAIAGLGVALLGASPFASALKALIK